MKTDVFLNYACFAARIALRSFASITIDQRRVVVTSWPKQRFALREEDGRI
jgi:hypothetical protein